MSKIQDLNAFIQNDVPAMNKTSEEVYTAAMQVKDDFNTVVAAAKAQIEQAKKDLEALKASMGTPPAA